MIVIKALRIKGQDIFLIVLMSNEKFDVSTYFYKPNYSIEKKKRKKAVLSSLYQNCSCRGVMRLTYAS